MILVLLEVLVVVLVSVVAVVVILAVLVVVKLVGVGPVVAEVVRGEASVMNLVGGI